MAGGRCDFGGIRILFSCLSGCEKVGRKLLGSEFLWGGTNGRIQIGISWVGILLYMFVCCFLYVHLFFAVVVLVVSRYSQTSCII